MGYTSLERYLQDFTETIIHSFRKYGITVALDGSEDYDINIQGLDSYTVPSSLDLQFLLDPVTSESDSNDNEQEDDLDGGYEYTTEEENSLVNCQLALMSFKE